MNKRTFARRSLLTLMLVFWPLSFSAAEDKTKALHFAIPEYIPVIIDRLLHEAFQRINHGITLDIAGELSSIQEVDSGEKDGLALQVQNLETLWPNLVMIPEKIATIDFVAYSSGDSALAVDSWDDLRDLRVARLFEQSYISNRISRFGGTHVRKRVPADMVKAVENGECDIFVLSTFPCIDIPFPDSVKKVGVLETRDVFPYLNAGHAGLALEAAGAIRAMKRDGTFEKIRTRESGIFRKSRNILVISSYAPDDAWEQKLEEGMRQELAQRNGAVYHFVSLNSNRITTLEGRENSAMGIIRPGLVLYPPDVVVALDINAMNFVGNFYSVLFDGIPVVLCGVSGELSDEWRFNGNATAITGVVPALENAYRILDLFPDTRTVFVVNDHTEAGREWRRQIDSQLRGLSDSFRVVHNEKGSLEELLSAIVKLPYGSVVLFGHYSVDGNMFYYPQAEIQRRARDAATVPIFGLRGDGIGYGQIGGKYADPSLYGRAAAAAALAILSAPAAAGEDGPNYFGELNSWIFDERELRRWGRLDAVHLPPDALIVNQRTSLYDEHPSLFILLCALFLLTLAVIGILSIAAHILKKKNCKLLEIQKTLHTAEELLSRDREIRDTRDRLEIALDALSAGVWEIDLVERTVTADRNVLRMSPIDPRGTLDNFLERIRGRQVGLTDSKFYKGLLAGRLEDEEAEIFAFRREDGELSYYKRCFRAMNGPDGKTEKIIGVLLDVTAGVRMEQDLRSARDAAEEANRSKSHFLSTISHEIRTPMNAIVGMVGLLLTGSLTAEQKKYASDIKISAVSLLVLINDILDISKMDAGRFELVPVHFDFGALLANLESMFTLAAHEKGITFRLDAEEGLPRCLFGDDIRLRQILVNLVGNGVKFTENGGVRLAVSLCGGMICFDISDTGRGMKEEDLERIFDSFEQLEQDKNRKITGTGLGLYITKNLVDLMEGSIDVKSEYGRGSHFHVELPFLPGVMAEMTGAEISFRFVTAPSARVLVVDDNEINQDVIVGMLKLHKIDCDVTLSGEEALKKTENTKYDIIFMDQMMPNMDGIETTARIRAKEPGGQASIIVALTANAAEGARDELLNAGMDDYLSKPIREEPLNAVLEKWLPKEKIAYGENPYEQSAATDRRYSELMDRLSSCWELDLKAGLERAEGRVEMYRRSLEIATRRLPEAIRRLELHLEKKDMKNFSIDVHGLKASLCIIGATESAEKARELEMQSKHGNVGYCVEHTPRFLEELNRMQGRLSAVLAEDDEAKEGRKNPGSIAEMKEKLPVVKSLLEIFAYIDASEIVRELLEFAYTPELNLKLKELMDHILKLESDRAIPLIEDLTA